VLTDVVEAKRQGIPYWARDSGSSMYHTKGFPHEVKKDHSECSIFHSHAVMADPSAQPLNSTDNVTKSTSSCSENEISSNCAGSRKGWHVFGWRDAIDIVVK
jgi:hypothetical protein